MSGKTVIPNAVQEGVVFLRWAILGRPVDAICRPTPQIRGERQVPGNVCVGFNWPETTTVADKGSG